MNMIPPLETDSTTAILLPRERRARTEGLRTTEVNLKHQQRKVILKFFPQRRALLNGSKNSIIHPTKTDFTYTKEMGTRLQRQTGQEVELANLSRGKEIPKPKDLLFGSNPTGVINRIDYERISTAIKAESSSVNNGASLHFLKLLYLWSSWLIERRRAKQQTDARTS